MDKKTVLWTLGILLGLFLLLLLYAGFAHASDDSQSTGCNANNPQNCPSPTQICGNGEHTGNPHCITPTPVISTPTPTLLISPTPISTPTVTDTPPVSEQAAGSSGPADDGLGCAHHSCGSTPQANTSSPQPTLAPCVFGQPGCGWK